MKIRQGFVSNSSSSSFLIYGLRFESAQEVQKFTGATVDDIYDDSCDFQLIYMEGEDAYYYGAPIAWLYEYWAKCVSQEDFEKAKKMMNDIYPQRADEYGICVGIQNK